MKNKLICYSVIISNCLYSCYTVTHQFNLRILSSVFVLIYYSTCFSAIFTQSKILLRQDEQTNKKWVYVYLLVVLSIFVFSVRLNLDDILTLLFHPYAFLAFFIAFVALTVDGNTVKMLKSICRKINNLYVIFAIVDYTFFGNPVIINELCYFIILEFILVDKFRRKMYITGLLVITILVENYFDYRTMVVRLLSVLIIFNLFYFFRFMNLKFVRFVYILSIVIVFGFITFAFEDSFNYLSKIVEVKSFDTTDTRSFLFAEFFQDFKGIDWLTGRGYLGTYFSQWFYEWEGDKGDSYQRFSLEVGVLEILLKGGVLLLLPYISLLVIAIKNGFYQISLKNEKLRISIFLSVQLVLIGVENIPSFSINYLVIWLLIGVNVFNKPYKYLQVK